MPKVEVYQFWHYDVATDTSRLSPSKRTEAEIRRIGKEPVPETAEEIDEAELDEDGRYHVPKRKRPA